MPQLLLFKTIEKLFTFCGICACAHRSGHRARMELFLRRKGRKGDRSLLRGAVGTPARLSAGDPARCLLHLLLGSCPHPIPQPSDDHYLFLLADYRSILTARSSADACRDRYCRDRDLQAPARRTASADRDGKKPPGNRLTV